METRRETHLSTQQTGPQAPPRIPRPYGDEKWPESRGRAPREGSQAPDGLMLTLKASADFQRIAKQGRKWSGTAFIMQVLKSEDTAAPFRVGFTVTRRIGNAVTRNRAK